MHRIKVGMFPIIASIQKMMIMDAVCQSSSSTFIPSHLLLNTMEFCWKNPDMFISGLTHCLRNYHDISIAANA
jgi:hypothetical protein